MGVTSQGVFLRLPTGWVIFISRQAHPGPLTINAPVDPSQLRSLADARQAHLSPQRILFPDEGFTISTEQAQIWTPPLRPLQVLAPIRRRETLALVFRSVLESKRNGGWIALLAYLAGDEKAGEMEGSAFIAPLRHLQDALVSNQASSIAGTLESFLGCGPGLTPSGDDLILGYLLALNRWGDSLTLPFDRGLLNRLVVTQAYQKTTTLAANLLECASRGLADQRLMVALDALMTGTPDVAAAVGCLLDWGSSSGSDALVGMALAIQSIAQPDR
jgi:hypothetical protein